MQVKKTQVGQTPFTSATWIRDHTCLLCQVFLCLPREFFASCTKVFFSKEKELQWWAWDQYVHNQLAVFPLCVLIKGLPFPSATQRKPSWMGVCMWIICVQCVFMYSDPTHFGFWLPSASMCPLSTPLLRQPDPCGGEELFLVPSIWDPSAMQSTRSTSMWFIVALNHGLRKWPGILPFYGPALPVVTWKHGKIHTKEMVRRCSKSWQLLLCKSGCLPVMWYWPWSALSIINVGLN